MRRRDAVILIGLACTGVHAQPQAQGQGPTPAPNVLRISTLLEDDPATTIASLILREAYGRLGVQIQVIKMPGERSLISANTGFTDGELYRKAGLDAVYPNLLMVPVALLHYEIVAFSKTVDIPILGWESLRPYRFDFVKGIKIIEDKTAGMRFETVTTMRQAFTKLELKRSELVLANRVSGLAAIQALKLSGVHVLAPPLASFPVFHYVHKQHADLVPRLSKVLEDLQQEKFMLRVHRQVLDLLTSAGP